jgi:alpha-1,2-mannosyltransferase
MRLITALRQGTWLTAERLSVYPKLLVLVYVVFGLAWAAGFHRVLMPDEGVVVTDFVNVYAAGVVAREGRADDAYDWADHQELEHKIERDLNHGAAPKRDPGNIPWLYPPMFLGVAWLVALAPYFIALGAYSIAGLIAYGATIMRLTPREHPSAKWIVAAFPAVFVNLFAGQNGSITTALLAAGLVFLDQSPLLAGAIFGLLAYKPHFFVLIPLVLLVGRHWRALMASLASAALCAALSLLAFGASSWQGFIDGLGPTRSEILENGSDRWLGILHSVF